VIEDEGYRFAVKVGKPRMRRERRTHQLAREQILSCLMSATPIPGYIKSEALLAVWAHA